MRKCRIAASTLIALLVLSLFSLGKEKRGAEIVVTKKDGTRVSGELIAVKKNSLLLLAAGPVGGTDLTVALDEINTVKIIKHSKVGSGLGYGLLIGGVGGAVIGAASGDDPEGPFSLTSNQKALVLGIGLGALGMILGAIGGGLAGRDEIISVEEKSGRKLQWIKEDLAKAARVKGIQ